MSKVLEKLLRPTSQINTPEEQPGPRESAFKSISKPGRPLLPKKMKAKNFTLCLAPRYLEFLDKMVVKDSKVKGRGRKIRFIIERFLEHEKRSLGQIKVLKESLIQVQGILKGLGGEVKKGGKMNLTPREKNSIDKVVQNVLTLMNILHYSPKSLQRILPREYWEILSFCLSWNHHGQRVIL